MSTSKRDKFKQQLQSEGNDTAPSQERFFAITEAALTRPRRIPLPGQEPAQPDDASAEPKQEVLTEKEAEITPSAPVQKQKDKPADEVRETAPVEEEEPDLSESIEPDSPDFNISSFLDTQKQVQKERFEDLYGRFTIVMRKDYMEKLRKYATKQPKGFTMKLFEHFLTQFFAEIEKQEAENPSRRRRS